MRKLVLFNPEFWWQPANFEIKKMSLLERHLAIYLLTNQHSTMTGIYYLPLVYIENDFNIAKPDIEAALRALVDVGFCRYDQSREYVWVCETGETQFTTPLTRHDNRVKAIHRLLKQLPPLSFMQEFHDRYHNLFFLE